MNKLEKVFNKPKSAYLKKIYNVFPDPKLIFSKPVVIFGGGRMGKVFLKNLQRKGVNVIGIIDNNISLPTIEGIPVVNINTAKKIFINYPILVASLMYEYEILKLLKRNKFSCVFPLSFLNMLNPDIFVSSEYANTFNSIILKKNQKKILQVYSLLNDSISRKTYYSLINYRIKMDKKYIQEIKSKHDVYSEKKLLLFTKNEVFVDCGGYIGDSVEAFIKEVGDDYSYIYSFEPDIQNYKKLLSYAKKVNLRKIIPMQTGLFRKTGYISFSQSAALDSRISENAIFSVKKPKITKEMIKVVSLDEYFADKVKPTFIKMDIEGAEIDALLGAKELIQKYKPKLAISIYHKSTDFWDIPLLIKKLNNNYKLYVRHYTDEIVDTMCIAI